MQMQDQRKNESTWQRIPLLVRTAMVIFGLFLLWQFMVWAVFPAFSQKPIRTHFIVADDKGNAYYIKNYGKTDQSLEYYDSAAGKNTSLKVRFIVQDTSIGPAAVNGTTGEIYAVSGTEIKKIGQCRSLSDGVSRQYVDIYDGCIYCVENKRIYRESIDAGEQQLLLEISGDHDTIHAPKKSIYMNGLYFYTYHNDDGQVSLLIGRIDLDTLKTDTVAVIKAEDGHDISAGRPMQMSDGMLGVYTDSKLFVFDCVSEELKTFPIADEDVYIYKGKAWYHREDTQAGGYSLYSADIRTGEEQLVHKDLPAVTKDSGLGYSDFTVCSRGYYYTIMVGKYQGLYFYDFTEGNAVKVY